MKAWQLLVSLALVGSCNAVRMDSETFLDEADPSPQCTAALATAWRSITFRDLFSPMFDGVYMVRNRFSGKLLTGTDGGISGTSLHHPTSSKMSDWRLKRVKVPGQPSYTLQNRKSGQFLAVEETKLVQQKKASQAALWKVELTADGVHHVIRSMRGYNLALVEGENGMLSLGEHAEIKDTVPASWAGIKGEWFFEQQMSWLRWPKSDENGYMDQWKVAGDIPVFHGTTLTWKKISDDADRDLSGVYANMRDFYKKAGKISETHRRIVTENDVQACDMTIPLMKNLISYSPTILSEMRKVAGEDCQDHSLTSIDKGAMVAIQEDCFQGCLDHATTYMKDLPCQTPKDMDAFWRGMVEADSCKGMFFEHVEDIARHAFRVKCQVWHPPALLWAPDRKDHISLLAADGNAVCSNPKKSRRSRDIEQSGTCPMGTTCQCPMTNLKPKKASIDLDGTNKVDTFIERGDSLRYLVFDIAAASRVRFAVNILIRGMTLASAGVATVASPFFVLSHGMAIFSWVKSSATWTCDRTVACWPVRPVRVKDSITKKKVCRLPDGETRKGGSPLYFMPPPGSQVRHRKWYYPSFRSCELAPCDSKMVIEQKVGFGPMPGRDASERTNIFNCQPLDFDEMTGSQKSKYVEKVLQTAPPQYAAKLAGWTTE